MYPQDFREIAKNYVIEAPKVERRTKNPDRIFQPRMKVLIDICASLFKDLKAAKLQYPKLFADQRRALTQLNANLTRIESPVLIMLALDDPVVQLERIFPQEMTRVGKAREQYLKKNVLPQAADVRVIVATKYANHIAFGVERPRPTSHVIARYFDKLRR